MGIERMGNISPVSSVWSMSPSVGSPVGSPDIESDIPFLSATSQDSNISYGMQPVMPSSKHPIPGHSSILHPLSPSSFTSVPSMSFGSDSVRSSVDPHLVNTMSSVQHICVICGDRSSDETYKEYRCESCKDFFENTVCKDMKKMCEGYCSCRIDTYRRNCCTYLPCMKCLEMGMKLNASYDTDGTYDRIDRSHHRMTYNDDMLLDNATINNISDGRSNRKHRPRIFQTGQGNGRAASDTETTTSVSYYPRVGGKKESALAPSTPNPSTVSSSKPDNQRQPETSIQNSKPVKSQSHGQCDPVKSTSSSLLVPQSKYRILKSRREEVETRFVMASHTK